jgi:hypothetical protein
VETGRRVRCVHFVELNRWFRHRQTAFLRPVDWD